MTNNYQKERVSGGLGRCMLPMLDALGWKGGRRTFLNALPYDYRDFNTHDMMNTMANLGFRVNQTSGALKKLDTRLLPCLFIDGNNQAYVLAGREEYGFFSFHGEKSIFETLSIKGQTGRFYFFKNLSQASGNPEKEQKEWFSKFFNRFKRPLLTAFLLSLILTLFALAAPFIVMGIYSQINTSEPLPGFRVIGAGIAGVLLLEMLFRLQRRKLIGYIGARMSYLVSAQVFKRILLFSPSATENAPVGSQIVRMRDFNSVKSFMEGPGMTSVMELPFLIILFAGLVFMGGYLAIIPVAAILLLVLFSVFVLPFVRKNNAEAAVSGSKKQASLIEFFSEFENIRMCGLAGKCKERFEDISADSTVDGFKTANINSVINHTSQAIVSMAGALTISAGVYGVLSGQYSSAVLIAAMMLVWKILAPVSSGFSIFSQAVRIKKSLQQLNRLMAMKLEPADENVPLVQFNGRIRFKGISLRYKPDYHPALLGVDLEIDPGQFIVIKGHDGAGKSTLLKLMMGMYKAQAGIITLDGTNIQQLPPALLRRSIAYLPQEDILFNTSIEKNMKLYSPQSSWGDIEAVLKKLELTHEIENLPEKLQTHVSSLGMLPDTSSFKKRLCLARTLLNDSRVLLLDEPGKGLEKKHINVLKSLLSEMKSRRTIVVASNHPTFTQLADKVIILNIGSIVNIAEGGES